MDIDHPTPSDGTPDAEKLTSKKSTFRAILRDVKTKEHRTDANGEYVKVYLYLLRCLHAPMKDLSISVMADFLERTESDIRRALRYWEKVHLLRLEYDDEPFGVGKQYDMCPPEKKQAHDGALGEDNRRIDLHVRGYDTDFDFVPQPGCLR